MVMIQTLKKNMIWISLLNGLNISWMKMILTESKYIVENKLSEEIKKRKRKKKRFNI